MAGSSGVANECLAGGPQTGVKPRSRTALEINHPWPIAFADLTILHRRSVTPTKINRRVDEGRRTTRGPGPAEMPSALNVAPKNARSVQPSRFIGT
jgi:hypothetical protein